MITTDAKTRLIYIIEDDPSSATMMREALELEGEKAWSVQAFTNSFIALSAIESEPPNLLLLDLKMPGMDGGTLFRKLREKPATENTPVLFITGANSHELYNSGIKDGVFLPKPVNLSVLLHVVRTYLD